MKSDHLLIIGCGDIGTRVGLVWQAAGGRVSAVRRSPAQLPAGFEGIAADYTCANSLAPLHGLCADAILFSPLPAGRDVAGYRRGFSDAIVALQGTGLFQRAARGVMISSTRVYAEGDGGSVEEFSALNDSDGAALAIIKAEQRFLGALPGGSVLRASGLYGLELGSRAPGMLLSRVLAGQASADPTRISNRVHREDLAAAVLHLLGGTPLHRRDTSVNASAEKQIAVPTGIYNCSDCAPTPIGEVEAFIAGCAGVTLHRGDAVGLLSGRGNRRVGNQRLLDTGFVFQYPDFRAGYRAILKALGRYH